MHSSESVSSVSPTFVGDAAVFQTPFAESAPKNEANLLDRATFHQKEEDHHVKSRPSRDATAFAKHKTPPKPTTLSRQRAMYYLPHDLHETSDSLLAKDSNFVTADDIDDDACEEDESYAFYVPPPAPCKKDRTDMTEFVATPRKLAMEERVSSTVSISSVLGVGNITLGCSYESSIDSPVVNPWKVALKAHPSYSINTMLVPATSTEDKIMSGLEKVEVLPLTLSPDEKTTTSAKVSTTSDVYATPMKNQPGKNQTWGSPTVAGFGRGMVTKDAQKIKSTPQGKRVSWLYPNGVPDDSTILQPTPVKSTPEGKRVSWLYPNGIPDDATILQPTPVRATVPQGHLKESPSLDIARLLLAPHHGSILQPLQTQIFEALEVGARGTRRFSYPICPSSEDEKLSLFPPRVTPKLYPCVQILQSPEKSSGGEMTPVQPPVQPVKAARRNTIPYCGESARKLLADSFELLQDNSAFISYDKKRGSPRSLGNRSHSFGTGAFRKV